MLCQLDLTVRSLSKGCFSALHELEIFFGDGSKHLLQADLLWGQGALIVAFLDERCRGLDPLDFGK